MRNRDSQIAYIAERDPYAAIQVGDAFAAATSRLESHPNIGRPARVGGTRELVVPGTPYVLIYRVERDALVILRLLHGAQDWPPEPDT